MITEQQIMFETNAICTVDKHYKRIARQTNYNLNKKVFAFKFITFLMDFDLCLIMENNYIAHSPGRKQERMNGKKTISKIVVAFS